MINSAIWWLVLGLMIPAYWLAPLRWRPALLATGSLGLLLHLSPVDTLVMATLAAWVFAGFRLPGDGPVARAMRSTLPIWGVLAYLVWAKYLPAIGQMLAGRSIGFELLVPLGVSYFSFKLLHYAIEMRRSNFPPHGAHDFAAWMFLAPIFTAGPIERFEHFLAHRAPAFRRVFLAEGALRIAHGLVKKLVVGALVLELIRHLSGGGVLELLPRLPEVSPAVVWAVLILTLVYVYLDFAAYSDIAIGTSRLFGITIMENFNFPWAATNLQGWWQRWHMTLANWCRAYIYMGMIGLTRNPYQAVIMTFLVMGIWHSIQPHWVIWGLWHGVGLAVLMAWGRFAQKRRLGFLKTPAGKTAGWAMTIAYVALGGAFTTLHQRAPVGQSVRLIARAFAIDI